jgi:hypothetical protein
LKGSEKAIEVAGEHCPKELGRGFMTLSKAELIRGVSG